jgi:hypothetical protein
MAPEVIEHKPYDEKADVFSFGVVLWELLTCKARRRKRAGFCACGPPGPCFVVPGRRFRLPAQRGAGAAAPRLARPFLGAALLPPPVARARPLRGLPP